MAHVRLWIVFFYGISHEAWTKHQNQRARGAEGFARSLCRAKRCVKRFVLETNVPLLKKKVGCFYFVWQKDRRNTETKQSHTFAKMTRCMLSWRGWMLREPAAWRFVALQPPNGTWNPQAKFSQHAPSRGTPASAWTGHLMFGGRDSPLVNKHSYGKVPITYDRLWQHDFW